MSSGNRQFDSVVLDTSAVSRLWAGHEGVVELLADAALFLLPVTVLGELEAGFEMGRRARANRVMLNEFLDEPFVSVLPVRQPVARIYGGLFAGLKRAGTPIPVNDIWIAASTLDSRSQLVTFDRHFAKVPGLSYILLET